MPREADPRSGCRPWSAEKLTRRKIVQAGGLGLLGLTLPNLLHSQAQAAALSASSKLPTFGKAKSCLIVFLNGGASHHDTFDMKPLATAEIRGEFQPISTNVPGMLVCEHLPQISKHFDKFTVVRSVTHKDGNHPSAVYEMMTGHEYPRASGLSENLSREDHPHIGSALALVEGANSAVPKFVTLPDYIAVNGPIRAGQHAGFLGFRVDPMVARGNPNDPNFSPTDLALVPNVQADRLSVRQGLLDTFNGMGRMQGLDRTATMREYDSSAEKAFKVLESGHTQRAFDIHDEPAALRERYGRNLFGQSVLLGRRLVEAGVRLVHVNWIRIREFGWDTHSENFPNLKHKLLPPTDQAFSALLEDMTARGLMDDTLVILMGEFGRSPKVSQPSGGREHWPQANSILMAGAGIPGGRYYGETDSIGAVPIDRPISPAQLSATIFHALGVDPRSQVQTMLGRPWQICDAAPVLDLWG